LVLIEERRGHHYGSMALFGLNEKSGRKENYGN
jgi:hypothetical protein